MGTITISIDDVNPELISNIFCAIGTQQIDSIAIIRMTPFSVYGPRSYPTGTSVLLQTVYERTIWR